MGSINPTHRQNGLIILKFTQLQAQEKSDERAKQLLGSRVVERVSESERENGNGREISSGSRQESHTQQGRSSSPVSQTHTTPNQRVISKTHENATGTP